MVYMGYNFSAKVPFFCVFNRYLRNSKSGELFCLNTALNLSTSNWTIFSLSSYQLGRKSALIWTQHCSLPKKTRSTSFYHKDQKFMWMNASMNECNSGAARYFPVYLVVFLCLMFWFCFSYYMKKNKVRSVHLDKKQKH